MRRIPFILSTVCALTILGAGSVMAQQPEIQRATPASDKSPGWVIILGANSLDSSTPEGQAHDKSIQWDSIRAFKQFNSKFHVPSDHIVLLADGDDVERFATTKAIPKGYEGNLQAYDIPKHSGYTESLLQNMKPGSDLALFKSKFYKDDVVPLHGKPSKDNFLIARDAVSHLAQSNQFVAVVVSSYVRAGSGKEGDTAKLYVMPGDASAGPSHQLTETDFQLMGCKAATRMLVIGGRINHEDEEHIPNYTSLLGILGNSGTSISTQPVVIAENESGQGDRTGKHSFLRYALSDLAPVERGLSEYAEMLIKNVDMSSNEHQIFEKPQIISTSPSTLAQLMPIPAEASKIMAMKTNIGIRYELQKDAGVGEPIGVVMIGNSTLVRVLSIPGTPFTAEKRVQIISDILKLQSTADLEKLSIVPGSPKSKPREYLLKTPKGQIVTVDAHTAKLLGRDPHSQAIAMRQTILTGMSISLWSAPGDGMSTDDYYNQGNKEFNAGNLDKAEENFRAAIEGNPSYFFARVALVECCLKQGKKPEAMSALAEINKGVQKNVFSLDDEGKKALSRVSGEAAKL